MRLTDPKLLSRYMEARGFSQADLARSAGCSRQFIHMLLNNDKNTCSKTTGERIEKALGLLPETIFLESVLPGTQQTAARKTPGGKAAA